MVGDRKSIKFGVDCYVTCGKYADNGRMAIRLVDIEDGIPMATVTVNMPDEHLEEGEVIVKNWAENYGLLNVLTEAGIVEDTRRRATSGYVKAPICKVNMEVLEEYKL